MERGMLIHLFFKKEKNMRFEKFGIGQKFKTNGMDEIEIVDKVGDNINRRVVRFNNGYLLEVDISAIRRGNVKNPFSKTVAGVGCYGVHKKNYDGKIKDVWHSMIYRCYSNDDIYSSYKNTTVCEDWHNCATFCEWYENNYPYHIKDIKFQIDKDLLQLNKKEKIYSQETCIFLPHKINSFFTNVQSNNTSGFTGVGYVKNKKIYAVVIKNFDTGKNIYLGSSKDINKANDIYINGRAEQSEKAKKYMRDISIYPEEIISLIK